MKTKSLSKLLGLGLFASMAVMQTASATVINEVEGNDTIATAQNVDGSFSVGANADIANAASTPWVSITSASSQFNTISYDYYSFSAIAGNSGIFDIDYGMNVGGSIDTELVLFGPGGIFITNNDDASTALGADGSVHSFDAYISHTFASSGLYTIGVCEFSCGGTNGTMTGGTPDAADTYTLQISVQNHEVPPTNNVPVPGTALLLGLGLLGLARKIRK